MLAYEVTSVPTSCFPTGSESSDEKEPSMIMYGRNNRTDNWVPTKKVPFEDQSVRFQHPRWRQDSLTKRGNYLTGMRGIICHVLYVKDDQYDPKCTLTLR